MEETLRSWARSNSNNSDINAIHNPKYINTGRRRGEGGPIPPQASSGCTSPIAAVAATSSTVGDPTPTATAEPVSTPRPETNPTTATANLSCPVTPPRIRTGGVGEAGGRNPTSTAGGREPRELTRLEYRIGKCTWRLAIGPKTDQKVRGGQDCSAKRGFSSEILLISSGLVTADGHDSVRVVGVIYEYNDENIEPVQWRRRVWVDVDDEQVLPYDD